MKRKDVAALRELSVDELQKKAREVKEELFNLRFQLRTGHLSNFSTVRAIRRDYARILTVIAEKRMAEDKHGAA